MKFIGPNDESNQKRLYLLLAGMVSLQFVGLFGLFVKQVQMNLNSGYLVISRFIGLEDVSQLGIMEKVSFFREDILLNLFLIPALVGLAFLFLNNKKGILINFIACIALSLTFFIGLYSLTNTGRFLTYDTLRDVIFWGLDNPSAINEYVGFSGFMKLGVILVCSTAILWIGNRFSLATKSLGFIGGGLGATAVIVSTASYNTAITEFPHHQSTLNSIASSLFVSEGYENHLNNISVEKLEEFYYKKVNNTDQQKANPSKYFATEKGADVVVFVLETAPSSTLEIETALNSHPALSKIKGHSFVANSHYSTYPYTSDAIFSIFTSLYPLHRKSYLKENNKLQTFGLLSRLTEHNYTANLYAPFPDTFEDDSKMYDLIGFQSKYIAHHDPYKEVDINRQVDSYIDDIEKSSPVSDFDKSNLARKLPKDLMAFEKMKADITSSKKRSQNFISVFLPQIGHAPWINIKNRQQVLDRGRDIADLQLTWLSQLVEYLDQNNWLNDTIIVLTADHGVRTRSEDPSFEGGKISNYSFKVPFFIFTPNALQEMHKIQHHTSHIDITPSVLSLLGIDSAGYTMQGLPAWDDRINNRKTYFLARGYLGSDGYFEDSSYYMYEPLTGATYKNDRMNFNVANLLQKSHEDVQNNIDTLYAISEKWVSLIKQQRGN